MKSSKSTPFIAGIMLIFCWFFLSVVKLTGTEETEREAVQNDNSGVSILKWMNEESGEELFNIDDIVRFDWDKQIFELTCPAAMNFMAKLASVGVEGRKFIVKDGRSVIYKGTLVTPISSIACQGPVIRDPILPDDIQPPLFKIGGGYPTDFEKGDMRFSERLKQALEQADMLGEIDVNNPPASIKKDSYGWFGEKDGLRVWVDVFPETFQLGGLARAHLHLTGSNYLHTVGYVVDINATVIADNDKFKYSTNRIFPTHKDGWKNVYAVGINPWNPDEDSVDKIAKPGPAEITFEICVRKIVDSDKSLYSEPVESVKAGPIQVDILSQDEEAKIKH